MQKLPVNYESAVCSWWSAQTNEVQCSNCLYSVVGLVSLLAVAWVAEAILSVVAVDSAVSTSAVPKADSISNTQ